MGRAAASRGVRRAALRSVAAIARAGCGGRMDRVVRRRAAGRAPAGCGARRRFRAHGLGRRISEYLAGADYVSVRRRGAAAPGRAAARAPHVVRPAGGGRPRRRLGRNGAPAAAARRTQPRWLRLRAVVARQRLRRNGLRPVRRRRRRGPRRSRDEVAQVSRRARRAHRRREWRRRRRGVADCARPRGALPLQRAALGGFSPHGYEPPRGRIGDARRVARGRRVRRAAPHLATAAAPVRELRPGGRRRLRVYSPRVTTRR